MKISARSGQASYKSSLNLKSAADIGEYRNIRAFMTALRFEVLPSDSFKKMSQKKKDKQITVLNTKSVFKLYSQDYTSSPSPCKEKARNRNILFSI